MDIEVEPKENIKTIKPIDKDTVHKICSGQVVLSLAIAVKELVENALDAGATIIEVRLKDYGMDLVEVSDNGSGVEENNFAALTLKYHTSKLRDFSDLLGVSSFGFRGEALSSLCALSDLTVTTQHASSNHATKIEYDHKGLIKKRTPSARQVGTTVTLTNLFSTLPVRHKEFHKNVKREFNKMTQLLYAYCLISQGVKITCTNQTKSGTKSVVVATQGSQNYRDNIVCVFGSKQLQNIMELKPTYVSNFKDNIFNALQIQSQSLIAENIEIDDVEIDLSEDSNDAVDTNSSQTDISTCSQSSNKSGGYKNDKLPFDFYGLVSSCAHGCGRSTGDRQFYYVNNRPCEPTKIMKLVNEIYKQYNPHQLPFVFLNLQLQRSAVDVNVTPDKRKVFLSREKFILDVLKSSFLKIYEQIPSTFRVENANLAKKSVEPERPSTESHSANSFLNKFAKNNVNRSDSTVQESVSLKRKATTMLNYIEPKSAKLESKTVSNGDENSFVTHVECMEENIEIALKYEDNSNSPTDCTIKFDASCDISNVENDTSLDNKSPIKMVTQREIMYLDHSKKIPSIEIHNIDDIELAKATIRCPILKSTPLKSNLSPTKRKSSTPTKTDKNDYVKTNIKTVTLKTSIEHIKSLLDMSESLNKKKSQLERIKFKSEINPASNKQCLEELSKEISKDSFKSMEIIGQFNLGFIISKLDDDLFIIDQHATDEIYNFETLQKTTELSSQTLVVPQQLDLTGVNEQILIDNLAVFKKNGFTFEINEEAAPTKRVKLLTIPISKNWVFGKDDIEELLFMLKDAPSEYCRPSRVRAMFASRACRKSVMIGTALSKADMKILINHMSEIDKPWNCPHGRPTIRHLVNLSMISS